MLKLKCFKTIKDTDFGLATKEFNKPRTRLGARGVIVNSENKIAILYKQKKNEYKLIGGGVEPTEEPIQAFKREALEECGCKIKMIQNIGTIEEHRSLDNFKQISFVYIASVIEDLHSTSFTEKEKGEGSETLWLNIDEAIEKIKDCENNLLASPYDGNKSIYHTKFIVRRDYEILKYVKENYGNLL